MHQHLILRCGHHQRHTAGTVSPVGERGEPGKKLFGTVQDQTHPESLSKKAQQTSGASERIRSADPPTPPGQGHHPTTTTPRFPPSDSKTRHAGKIPHPHPSLPVPRGRRGRTCHRHRGPASRCHLPPLPCSVLPSLCRCAALDLEPCLVPRSWPPLTPCPWLPVTFF